MEDDISNLVCPTCRYQAPGPKTYLFHLQRANCARIVNARAAGVRVNARRESKQEMRSRLNRAFEDDVRIQQQHLIDARQQSYDEELARLIREQAQDEKRYIIQHGVSLDAPYRYYDDGITTLADYLDDEGNFWT